MPTYVNIRNNLPSALNVNTTVSPPLGGGDWGVDSDSPPSEQTTRVLWMNREEGIHDGDTWVFTTEFEYAGVAVRLQEQLTGTLFGSTLEIQIAAGGQSTGWQSASATLGFDGADGNAYRVNGTFSRDGLFDDVTYSIGRAILPQINHVVVLMLENRSLDNLLGWVYADAGNRPPNNVPPQSPTAYDGLVENTCWNQLTPDSPRVYAVEGAQSTTVPNPDPDESFDGMTAQIFGTSETADMSGFLANYATQNASDPDQIMQSYSPSQVPVISQLARSFALCDAWFASAPCQTWPNRGFVHTGSSDGHINNDDYKPYDIETVFNLLEDQGISWNVYNDTLAPSLVHVMFPKLWDKEDHFADMKSFYVLCQQPATSGTRLPQYTFIEPNFIDPDESYHPPHDITPAETFLAKVYNAVRECPYRDEILFVITFDEHGGCYDHVPPPPPPLDAVPPEPGQVSRDGSFDFKRFGVRVPTIVVSSYVTPGTVFRNPPGAEGPAPYDHTTILNTLRQWLGIPASTFTATLPSPRIAAAPTLEAVLTETTPQPWPYVEGPQTEAPPADMSEPPNDLVMSMVVGEASRRAGAHVGRAGVAALRQKIRTVQDARAFFASPPAKKK